MRLIKVKSWAMNNLGVVNFVVRQAKIWFTGRLCNWKIIIDLTLRVLMGQRLHIVEFSFGDASRVVVFVNGVQVAVVVVVWVLSRQVDVAVRFNLYAMGP